VAFGVWEIGQGRGWAAVRGPYGESGTDGSQTH
jgi:hypothetical protein